MSGRVPLPVVDRLGEWGRVSQDPASGREILAECLLCGWAHVYDRPEDLSAGWGAHLDERHPRRVAQSRRWEQWQRRSARFVPILLPAPYASVVVSCPACDPRQTLGVVEGGAATLWRLRAATLWRLHAYDYHPRRLYRSDRHG